MITCMTLRDSNGRLKTFSKNQDFSVYEKHKWQLGKGIDGSLVSYLEVMIDSKITLGFGHDQNSFMVIYVNAGDFFTLEDENSPYINKLTPFV